MTVKRLGWLMGLILICSLTLNQTPKSRQLDLISDIRAWAFKQKIWPHLSEDQGHTSLIAVREIYKIEQAQLLLRVYLLMPCRNLCGLDKTCARQCQQMIKDWTGDSFDARLLIDGFDLKNNRSLGRVTLKTIAPVKLRYWSRQQRLIALTQVVNAQDHRLHLIQLVEQNQVDHLQEFKRSSDAGDTQESKKSSMSKELRDLNVSSSLTLRYYDNLSLGPFSGISEAEEGATEFVDLDNDQHIELVAPLKSLVHLTPLPIAVPTPYRLTPQGLSVDTQLISATSPPNSELRTWIMNRLALSIQEPKTSGAENTSGTSRERSPQKLLLKTMMQAKVIYVYAAQLCLKSMYDEGEKLIHFAYPQHEVVLRVWEQLRDYISVSTDMSSSGRPTAPHPFSALDQASVYQDALK
jgi:hypothetical protein